jgi:hypothetical protein
VARPLSVVSEFAFELRVCAWAERNWHPSDEEPRPCFVARQLGTRDRRWDTVVVEVDPEGLAARANFGTERLDSDLLHVVRNAPADWQFYRDALPHPGYPWRYVREAVHRGADRGVVEKRRNGNRIELRRKWPYPNWVQRIVAVENKPDLDASAADVLADQLERDVALALADEVWLATQSTEESVEPALLREMPVEAGILAFDDRSGDGSVAWHPRSLDSDAVGTRITDRPPGGSFDQSPATFEYADAEWKAEKRLEIAERAYERGWRSYLDTMRPDCRHFAVRQAAHGYVPWCAAKNREPTAAECSGSCGSCLPEPPAWRQKNWPVEGGPGKAIQRVLEERRQRQR